MVKRTLVVVLLLLIIGAIINIAVAWSCAWYVLPYTWDNGSSVHFESGPALSQGWNIYRWEAFGSTRITAGHDRDRTRSEPLAPGFLPAWSDIQAMATRNGDSAVGMKSSGGPGSREYSVIPLAISDDARGWPMRSMRCWWDSGLITDFRTDDEKMNAGILLEPYVPQGPQSWNIDEQRAFPLQPIWLGFIANSMFYALVLFVLGGALIWLRRTVRTARGGCPKCGYPVGSSPVCTECGRAIPSTLFARLNQTTSKTE